MSWLSDKIESLDDPGAPTTPTRAIGTGFAPSATKSVWCSYTINIVNTSGQTTTVELRSDAADPPTTVRTSAKLISGATDGQTARQQLTYICPPGHNVKLVASGTGAATISEQTEMVIS
jgi:hypothetical protein